MIVWQTRQKNVVTGSRRVCLRKRHHLQKQNRCSLDRDAGESSTPARSSVDVDSIRTNLGMRNRCVSVNNQLAMIEFRVEKVAADPEQIVELLLFEGNAGADAGMDEQKIPAAQPGFQTLQEQCVGAREHPTKPVVEIL